VIVGGAGAELDMKKYIGQSSLEVCGGAPIDEERLAHLRADVVELVLRNCGRRQASR
jgi:hypothetical protein